MCRPIRRTRLSSQLRERKGKCLVKRNIFVVGNGVVELGAATIFAIWKVLALKHFLNSFYPVPTFLVFRAWRGFEAHFFLERDLIN